MRIEGNPKAMAAMAGVALFFFAVACGDGEHQVTGLVLEAVGRNISEVETLRHLDDDGRVWEFSTVGPVGISAAHLRQHQLAGERVLVTYREKGGRLIASDVKDAVGPGIFTSQRTRSTDCDDTMESASVASLACKTWWPTRERIRSRARR